MSDHSVLVKRVEHVVRHPNADKLEIIKLEGLKHTIISGSRNFKVGDAAVFFPEDVILPDNMVKHFDLTFLKKGRVKTTKIRGIYSQALILPLEEVLEFSMDFLHEFDKQLSMTYANPYEYDFSKELNITRQEEEVVDDGIKKGGLPEGVEKYDLENSERYPEMFDTLLHEQVVITEKLEGTNFAVHVTADELGQMKYSYCSRTQTKSGGMYEELPRKYRIQEIASWILENEGVDSVTIRGEIIGSKIQGNIYKLQEKICFVFDIMIDGTYVSTEYLIDICNRYGLKHVPILYQGKLSDFTEVIETLKLKSNGKSMINPEVLREGLVIRSKYGTNENRIVFKQRSPMYLGSKNG